MGVGFNMQRVEDLMPHGCLIGGHVKTVLKESWSLMKTCVEDVKVHLVKREAMMSRIPPYKKSEPVHYTLCLALGNGEMLNMLERVRRL